MFELEEGNNLTTSDKQKLSKILQDVRSNEKSYMVTPEHTKFRIAPDGNGQGTSADFGIKWIEHNDSQITRNVLAGFLTMGHDQKGTLGFGSRLTDMFISSLAGVARGISSDLKQYCIKPLCDFNFDMTRRKYPKPECVDLEQVDLQALIQVLAQLTGTVITPQDSDEALLRKIIGMPPLDAHLNRKAQSDKMKKPGDGSAAPSAEEQMQQEANKGKGGGATGSQAAAAFELR
jgi:hypothetical protein